MNDLFDRLARTPARWLAAHGPDARVVHSTRVRLARNLESMPFPGRADAGILERIKNEARRLASTVKLLKGMHLIDMDQLGPLDRAFLVERHLISREFSDGHGRLLILDDHENVAIMVNEEDHFRLQVLRNGLDAMEAWRVLKAIERDLDGSVTFAFRPPWGYLTSCPTNLGTGLRVSALCHLHGLASTGQLNGVLETAARLGIAVRGFYGEGTAPIGHFFQISNRTTLGQGEDEIVSFIESGIRQIVASEISARERLVATVEGRVMLEDRVWRSCAVLGAARVMSTEELMEHLSILRLGIDLEIIERPDIATLNMIQVLSQPSHLQRIEQKPLTPAERDMARAKLVRERVKSNER